MNEVRDVLEDSECDCHDSHLAALDRLVARLSEAEQEIDRYRASLVAHHEISTLSDAAIRESIGGTCQICARAHA